MAVVVDRAPAAPSRPRPPDERRLLTLQLLAVLLAGVAVVVVVVLDGSPVWQFVRGVVAAACCGVVLGDLLRLHGRHRNEIAVVIGALATATGIGLAVPHVTKTGLSLVSAAGAVLLAGGLVLVTSGSAFLTVTARGWRRAATIPAALGVLFVAVWSLGQAVAATNVPRIAVGDRTPADLGLPYEDVRFGTPDREVLAGWYVPSTNGAAVVLLHGAGSTRAAVLDHAAVLAGRGYGVLLLDARGHGDSTGHAMDFGWYGDEDVEGAVSFLQTRPDVDDDRIAAVGLSMGGEEAIGAAAADHRIAAVVAEGAGHRVAADKAWLADRYGLRGWLQVQLDRLTDAVTDLLTAADPPVPLRTAVAEAAPRPVLLIAAGAVDDERHEAAAIAAGSPGTVEVWVAGGAGHTGALRAHPAEWEDRVIRFLDAAVGAG